MLYRTFVNEFNDLFQVLSSNGGKKSLDLLISICTFHQIFKELLCSIHTKVGLFKTNTDNHHKRLDLLFLISQALWLPIFIHISYLATTKVFFPLVDRKSMFNIVYCKCIIFGSNKFALALENQYLLRLFSEKKTRQIEKDLFK